MELRIELDDLKQAFANSYSFQDVIFYLDIKTGDVLIDAGGEPMYLDSSYVR